MREGTMKGSRLLSSRDAAMVQSSRAAQCLAHSSTAASEPLNKNRYTQSIFQVSIIPPRALCSRVSFALGCPAAVGSFPRE